MLRKRLITVLTFQEGVLCRTKMFEADYRYTQNFIDAWSVDEIVALDITRGASERPLSERKAFRQVVEQLAERCFVPLAVGGGIRSLDDVSAAMSMGADKVVLNTGALLDPHLIGRAASHYGSQCVIVSIDARRLSDGTYRVFSDCGRQDTGLEAVSWAVRAQNAGAGEILLTSIERDGSLLGYELELSSSVAKSVSTPVLICGGAGNWQHFVDGIRIGLADAVCTSNIYHFTETSIRSAKTYMARAGIDVRL
ncbi:MAG: imidazole glycerol phosphate synthase subunit HisF [Rhodospirillales bacterium]|nr:MAG: imidazole glycerol phosphate synthase subunit HisF [Rhodospirillales bacterium]